MTRIPNYGPIPADHGIYVGMKQGYLDGSRRLNGAQMSEYFKIKSVQGQSSSGKADSVVSQAPLWTIEAHWGLLAVLGPGGLCRQGSYSPPDLELLGVYLCLCVETYQLSPPWIAPVMVLLMAQPRSWWIGMGSRPSTGESLFLDIHRRAAFWPCS